MSAFYSFVYPDRVQLLTDGATLDADGVLIGVGRKVFTLPRLPLAITGRGSVADLTRLLTDMEMFIDSTIAADSVDVVLMAMGWFFAGLKEKGQQFNAEFLIAAFSEEHGPCQFYVHCHGHRDMPAFEIINPGPQICGGSAALSWADIAHLGVDADDIASPDFPDRHGVSIMEAIRRKLFHPPGTELRIYGVGGQCDLTTVTSGGAFTRTLCRWADEIGKPIDPDLGFASTLDKAVA